MSEIINLPPAKLHELADTAEDEAYLFAPGPTRQRMLAIAFDMRRCANLAQWLGETVQTESVTVRKSW